MLGSPLTGLHVNITPEISASTISWTVTPIAASRSRPEPGAVGDRGRAVEADPAVAHRLAHLLDSAHPQERLLLAGERRLRAVLADRARAHRDGRLPEGRVRAGDLISHVAGHAAPRIASPIASASPAAIAAATASSAANSEYAAVDRANPGGTGISAASSSPRLALLPPKLDSSLAAQPIQRARVAASLLTRQQGHGARRAVDADHLAGADLRRWPGRCRPRPAARTRGTRSPRATSRRRRR